MIKVKADISHIISKELRIPTDRMYNFLINDGNIRGAIIENTLMVNEMRFNHQLGIIETLALGYAYTAAGLLTSDMKGTEKVVMQIDCTGPLKGLSVEATAHGEVRGYLKNREIGIDQPVESFDLSPFFGTGFLKITKYLEKDAQPYTGQVVLKYGTIAEDLAYYYLTSEQVPSSFHLSIKFDRQGNVTGAGGLALHAMPGAGDQTIDLLETKLQVLRSLGDIFENRVPPETVLNDLFFDMRLEVLKQRPLRFYCSCSKERFNSYMNTLPQEDLIEMRTNGPFPIIVTCHNCATSYEFSEEEIGRMIR